MDINRAKDILNLANEILAAIPSETDHKQEDVKKLMEICRSLAGACMQNLDLSVEMKNFIPASSIGEMYRSVRYVYERGNSFSSTMSADLRNNVQVIIVLLEASLKKQMPDKTKKRSLKSAILKPYDEYRRLSMLGKLGVWGSVASIVAIIITFALPQQSHSDNIVTQGGQSPIISGNGNTVNYSNAVVDGEKFSGSEHLLYRNEGAVPLYKRPSLAGYATAVCMAESGTSVKVLGNSVTDKNMPSMLWKEVEVLNGQCQGKSGWTNNDYVRLK